MDLARATGSTGVDVNMDGQDENSIENEEDNGVHRNRFAVGLKASELHQPVVTRYLKQKARLKQYEEYNSDKHGAPIRHC